MKTLIPKSIRTIKDNVQKNSKQFLHKPKPLTDEVDLSEDVEKMPNAIKEGKPSVAVCIPAYGTLSANWFINFMRFLMRNIDKYVIHLLIEEHQPVSVSRNELIESALKKNPDYILFIDTDNALGDQTLPALINTMTKHKADLVTALYLQKDPPHYPVIREYKSNGFWKIENPQLGQQFEIAGCGLGCCLLKPEIFQKIEKPYFMFSHEKWGDKDITLSEDLYFCRQLMRNGLKMVVDTGIVSCHIGGPVDAMEYMTYAPIRESTRLERIELMEDLVRYTGKTQYDIDMLMIPITEKFNQEWISKNPQTKEEIKNFWKESDLYLYWECLRHFSSRRKYDIEVCTAISAYKKRVEGFNKGRKLKVLDFGCGIGQNGFMLSRIKTTLKENNMCEDFEVTIADIGSKAFDFAKYRYKYNKIPHKVWDLEKDENAPEEKYDVILIMDVLEYMTMDEVRKLTPKIINLKHPRTYTIITHNQQTPHTVLNFDTEVNLHLKAMETHIPFDKNLNHEEYWNDIWEYEGNSTWRKYPENFGLIIKRINEKKYSNPTILDIGCGVGVLLKRFLGEIEGCETHGIDISPKGIQFAVDSEPRIRGKTGNFIKMNDLDKDKFDVITATEFIEHLKDDELEEFFKRLKQTIKPEGMFAITTPNDNMPKHICQEHEQSFNEERLRPLLEKHFKKVDIVTQHCSGISFLLAFCEGKKA